MFELISCIYDQVSEETIVLIQTDSGRRHFLREDPEKELYNLVQVYLEDPSEEKQRSLELALTPKSQLAEQFSQIDHENFRFENGRAYMNDTRVPVPEAIAMQINRFVQEGKQDKIRSLINFWALALMNPNPDARDRFFEYCMEYGATLTPSGHVFLYKSVQQLGETDFDERLVDFVNKQYEDALSDDFIEDVDKYFEGIEVWVHNRMNVYTTRWIHGGFPDFMEDVDRPDISFVGLISELREKFQDTHGVKALYTDWYSRTFRIRLGEPQFEDRNLCDPNINHECSKGLHVGSYRYVRHFNNYDGVTLGVLVNPANVVALPNYDNSKIRVCEYYPYCVMTKDEDGNWEEIPSVFTEIDYQEYEKGVFEDALITSLVDGGNVHVTQVAIDLYANSDS
jgi:hypothetical protein